MNNLLHSKKSVRYLSLLTVIIMTLTGAAGCRKKAAVSETESNSKPQSISSFVDSESIDSNSEAADSSDDTSADSSDDYSSSTADDNSQATSGKWINLNGKRNRPQIKVTQVVNKNGKRYIERLGRPYLIYGVQITTLDRFASPTEKQEEEFYEKAAEINFKTVLKAITWTSVEPEENKYNMYPVQQMLSNAYKYNLQVEMLWFGGNVCGSTKRAPKYVRENSTRFPMKDSRDFDYSNAELIKRECAALKTVMEYIYDNDPERRLTVVQVNNETNAGSPYIVQKDAYLNYLNQIGLTVKNSPQSVVTRVNMVSRTTDLKDGFTLAGDILRLDGIDMVGPDLYARNLEYYSNYIERYSTDDLAENIPHVAEAPGQMDNYPKQVLNAFSLNAGYDVYELKAFGSAGADFGIFRYDADKWIKRDGKKKVYYQWDKVVKVNENVTDDIVVLNKMIAGVAEQIASCPNGNFKMIFRRQSDYIGEQKITFVTYEEVTANRVGAAFLAADGYYYMFTPAGEGYFRFENKTLTESASVGVYEGGVWKETNTVRIEDGNKINVKKGYVYRIMSSQIK